MILLEEQIAFHGETTEEVHRGLAELLHRRWRSYRKAFKSCRRKFSEKSVHALRVEIRRMLSTLTLVGVAVPDEAEGLECELKDRLKALSRLRDTQVQLDAIEEMVEDAPELKGFGDWLRRRERRLIKRLKNELAEARTRKAARCTRRLMRALQAAESRNEEQALAQRLVSATGRVFQNVKARYHRAGSRDLAMIHRIRVAFKKFRYMVEALARIMPGITGRQLRAMQAYQKRMGKIQDVEVLLTRVEKFAKKGEMDDTFFQAFREKLLRRRARLVKGFLASADRLLEFWPIQSAGQRTTGRFGLRSAESAGSFARMLASSAPRK